MESDLSISFINKIRALTFSTLSLFLCISPAQAQSGQLILMYTELEPYVIVKDGVFSGFLADYLNSAAKAANVQAVWEHIHWDRQLPILKETKNNVCAVALYETPERRAQYLFSAAIGFDPRMVLIGAPNNEKLQGHSTFKAVINDSRIAPILQIHSVYSPYINELLEGKTFPATKGSIMRITRSIKSGKYDYMILARHSAENVRDQHGLAVYDHYSDLTDPIPYYLICSKNTDSDLFNRLNAEIIRKGPSPEN